MKTERFIPTWTFNWRALKGASAPAASQIQSPNLSEALIYFHAGRQLGESRPRDGYEIVEITTNRNPAQAYLKDELPANPDIAKCVLPPKLAERYSHELRKFGVEVKIA